MSESRCRELLLPGIAGADLSFQMPRLGAAAEAMAADDETVISLVGDSDEAMEGLTRDSGVTQGH